MGWMREDEGLRDQRGRMMHEGYAVGVLPDGTVPTYLIGDYVAERSWWGFWGGDREGEPRQDAVALRPRCQCGWRGEDVPLDTARAYKEDDEDPAREQWAAHVDTLMAVTRTRRDAFQARVAVDKLAGLQDPDGTEPLDALRTLRELRQYLDQVTEKTVAAALNDNASWSQIGTALGVAKQTAWRKYGKADDPIEAETL